MTMTDVDVFDKTINVTNDWLKDLMFELNWTERHEAYLALRACLKGLRDRLTVEEASHLGAQLPMLIRGFYYEGWKPSQLPEKIQGKDVFLKSVQNHFNSNRNLEDPETVVRAVFKLLCHRVSEGEMEDIKSILPEEIEELLPQKMEP